MRSFEAWKASTKNFEWLGDAVPGGMDIDLLVERKGQFVVAEAKPWTMGVVVGLGQHLALSALSRIPEVSVWLIGEASDGVKHLAEYGEVDDIPRMRRGGKTLAYWPADRFEACTMERVQSYLRGWWDTVSAA